MNLLYYKVISYLLSYYTLFVKRFQLFVGKFLDFFITFKTLKILYYSKKVRQKV